MTFRKFGAASLFALVACAAVFAVLPDIAHAAPVGLDLVHSAIHAHGAHIAGLVLATGLDGLRNQHADLKTRAAAKLAELKDGLAPEAATRIEAEHAELVRDISSVAEAISAEERRAPTASPAPASAAADLAAERTRSAEITRLAVKHGMPVDFASRHIADGTSLDTVRGLVLDAVAARSEATLGTTRGVAEIGRDEGDTIRNAVEAAIMLRANPRAITTETAEGRALVDQAREWRGMGMLEIGREYFERTTGSRLRGLSKMDLAGRLLNLDGGVGLGRRDLSTSDFPAILANVIAKRLRSAYQVAPQNWKKLARQSNAPDFKPKAVVQLSNLPNLKQIREGGEYTHAALADGQETYALATYGRIVVVTRQTLINDDLGAFDRLPMLLGRAAAETEAAAFWAILTGNPNMNDATALFHANHGNLAASGAAISIAALNAARAAMRKQKGLAKKAADAEPLNLTPAFLVVSPDKETEAQQFLATTLYPNQNSQVNPFAGSMLQITEARLTGNTWYVFADPASIDTIEYAYLEGEEGLYTEQRLGFEVDGIEIKGRLDFAAKAIDWRGMYQNPGA